MNSYVVMKHVHPGEDMNNDFESILELDASDWEIIRYSVAGYHNELLRVKRRMQRTLASNPNAKLRRRPSELTMELAEARMLYDRIAAAFPAPAPIKKGKKS